MSALDTINANGQDYDIMSPEVVSDYVEKIGTICKNPNGYTKGSLFLARDAQNVERMYKATSAIASNQTITSGTNCTVKKLGDLFNDVDSDVSQVKQALSDEVVTRATLGAHNFLQNKLASQTNHSVVLQTNNDETTDVSGSIASGDGNISLDVNADVFLPAGTYILSGIPSGVQAGYGYVQAFATTLQGGDLSWADGGPSDTSLATKTFAVDTHIKIKIMFYASHEQTFDFTYKPMIRLATDADETYRPYVPTNAELLSYKDNGVLGAKNLLDATVSTWTSTAGENKSQTIGEIYLKAGTSIVFTVKQETSMTSNTRNTIIVTPKGQQANAVVEDNTANYMLSAGTHKITYTAPADHTYVFSIWCHTPNVAITYSDFMVRLATDTDPTYQPYAMTNKELTGNVLSLLANKAEYMTFNRNDYSGTDDYERFEAFVDSLPNPPQGKNNVYVVTMYGGNDLTGIVQKISNNPNVAVALVFSYSGYLKLLTKSGGTWTMHSVAYSS